MAITPLEGIIFANQNMQVAASKQIDYRGRVDFQNLVAGAKTNEQVKGIAGVDNLVESKKIDAEKEHQREKADEESGAKEQETLKRYENMRRRVSEDELYDSLPYHILDIRV